jgi:hypothetical protein
MDNFENIDDNKCFCKGIRTCAYCEEYKNIKIGNPDTIKDIQNWVTEEAVANDNEVIVTHYYILRIDKEDDLAGLGGGVENEKMTIDYVKYVDSDVNEHIFSGFYKIEKLLTEDEIQNILKEVNNAQWFDSQSGRKKQDFGPKINYKKRKVKFNEESTFPDYSKILQEKINQIPFLQNFKTAEIGNLFYTKQSGAHIDPHIDDYWIWGNNIIGLNLLSETVITFTYNLNNIQYELNFQINPGDLYIMSNESRYIWKHSVKKENIFSDRIVITLREFDKNYLNK